MVQLELFSITSCAAAHNLLRWRELDPHFGVSVKIFFQLNLTYCDGFISSVDHLGSFSILLWIWIGGSKSLHVSLLSPLGDLEIGPSELFFCVRVKKIIYSILESIFFSGKRTQLLIGSISLEKEYCVYCSLMDYSPECTERPTS